MTTFRATQVTNDREEIFVEDGWCRTGSAKGPTARINSFVETGGGLQAAVIIMEKGSCGDLPHLRETGKHSLLGSEDLFPETDRPIWGWCPDCEIMGYFDYRRK